ncbi:hypothetical protein PSAB6_640011 [Paraburkholderia sabiae]|nr:hypothetical protein PSAB6_640011 [Paraburkholderia sabiae]
MSPSELDDWASDIPVWTPYRSH